jgi:hypothetical protein
MLLKGWQLKWNACKNTKINKFFIKQKNKQMLKRIGVKFSINKDYIILISTKKKSFNFKMHRPCDRLGALS